MKVTLQYDVQNIPTILANETCCRMRPCCCLIEQSARTTTGTPLSSGFDSGLEKLNLVHLALITNETCCRTRPCCCRTEPSARTTTGTPRAAASTALTPGTLLQQYEKKSCLYTVLYLCYVYFVFCTVLCAPGI
jgi:hypothetical protein